MIDCKNYDKETRDFIQYFYELEKTCSCCSYIFNNCYVFDIDCSHNLIQIYANDGLVASYTTVDEMLTNFILDGKPFLEQIDFIDYN